MGWLSNWIWLTTEIFIYEQTWGLFTCWRNGIVDRNHFEKYGYNLIHRCTLVEMCPVNMVTKPVYKSRIEIL